MSLVSEYALELMLRQTYRHFNERDIEATLASLHQHVDWPNAMDGGFEKGREAVREYWTKQWNILSPHVDPIAFHERTDGRIDVTVHQVVHDLEGKRLVDQIIHHLYTFEDGLVRSMEIINPH